MRWRPFGAAGAVLLSTSAMVLFAAGAVAQTESDSPSGMDGTPAQPPPPVALPPPAAAPRLSIQLPTEKTADLLSHWSARRAFLRERDERRADDEEQRIRQLKDELSIENLFSIGGSLVRESHEALAAGSPPLAIARCKLALEFAPALAAAHACLARALLSDSVANWGQAINEVGAATSATLSDPRASRSALVNLLAVLIGGLFVAGIAYVLLLFARYVQLYLHDLHHLFPPGARRWQSGILAVAVLSTPLLLKGGALPLLFLLMVAIALYATGTELAVACLAVALWAFAPYAARGLLQLAAYGGPAADVWLVEHGEGTPAEIARLQARLEGGPEFAVAFALARKAKRDGDLGGAEAMYRRALELPNTPPAGAAAARNNLGNVYVLQGDAAKGLAQYQQAIEVREGLAAPHFNVARALALGGVETLDKVQAEQGRALELDRAAVERFTGGQLQANRRANKFTMDVGLEASLIAPLVVREEAAAGPVLDEMRARLASGLAPGLAPLWPLAAIALALLLHSARLRVRPSGRCERCGREVCRRCDPDARPSEALCAQCVHVFVRRGEVDPIERIRKEHAVQAFHRRRKLWARLIAVFSGAGHVLLGYPVRGALFLVLLGWLLAAGALWSGLARDPIAIQTALSPLRLGALVGAFVLLYGICLRDLIARQRAEAA